MNALASMLLGILTPGTTDSTALQAGAVQTNGDAASGVFQDLLTQTMEQTAPQVETSESWAGQQAMDAEAEVPKTDPPAEASQNLLGSADVTAVVPEVVIAANIEIPQSQAEVVIEAATTASEEPSVAQTEMISTENSQPKANAGSGQPVQTNALDTPPVVEDIEQKAGVPQAELVTAGDPVQGTAASGQEIGLDMPVDPSVSVTEQAGTGTIKVSEKLHVSVHESDGAKPHSREQVRYSLHVKADDIPVQQDAQAPSAINLVLPEADAPIAVASTLDYQSLRLKLKLDVDAKPHERIHEKAMLSMKVTADHTPADLTMATASVADIVNAVTGKVVFASETLKSIQEIAAVIPADSEIEGQAETFGQTDRNLAVAQSDVRPFFEKAVIGAERSQGFHMPERVIEQKVIHQIVQSAKVQMTDGGASMSLRLDPPHLGTVQMDVTAQQGLVVANIRTSTEAARHVLEADMASLKQALSDAGITVDSINVSLGEMPDYTSTAHGREQFERRSHGAHSPHRFGVGGNDDDTEPAAARAREHRMTAATLDYLA